MTTGPVLADVHVAPLSVLLSTPVAPVAYAKAGVEGEMATRSITMPDPPARVQVAPLSVDRYRPASVPAIMVVGVEGLIAIALTLRGKLLLSVGRPEASAVHVAPVSVVRQTPADSVPAKIVDGCVG